MSPDAANKSDSPLTEELFRTRYGYEEIRRPPLGKVIAKKLKCTKKTVLNTFPIAKWLPEYSVKGDLMNDAIAGATVAIMHIPHGLSYAPLGKTDPVVGLYMAIFPVFIYIFMGTSRQISIGTFAVVCAMVGEIVNDRIPSTTNGDIANATTMADVPEYTPLQVGTAVCLLVGLWQSVLGLLKLGILLVVMSNSLISGFTTGAACYVFSYQLKYLFGINVASFKGKLKLFYLYIDFFSKIKTTNLVTLALSLSAIVVLLIFNEYIKPLVGRKYPKNRIPIPIELAVIFIGIFISYFCDLSNKYDVKTVRYIPKGLPRPDVPPFSLLPVLILPAFIVAIVALTTNLSLAKIFAKKANYTVSDNQELLAYGAANVFSSFFLCLPSAASLSRSSIQFSTGGKTQLASAFSSVLIMLVVLFAGPLFEPVPYCVLSSVVVVTLKGLFMQFNDLPKIFKANYWDGIVWLGTFLAVIILDIDIGLGVGIVLSVLTMTFSSLMFQVNVMGRAPDSKVVLDVRRFKTAITLPQILILQIVGNFNYGNSSKLEKKILDEFNKFSANSMEDESFLVLDMGSVVRVDPTSVETLKQLHSYLSKSSCTLYLTHCNVKVYSTLEKCSFFKGFPKNQVMASTEDAIEFLTKPA